MVAKLKEAELQRKTTEVQLQQIQLEMKIQSARARGGYDHLMGVIMTARQMCSSNRLSATSMS